jgi:hypothetical protein
VLTGLETIRDDVACLQAPPNDLRLLAGDFVLNLLAEQKMTQVNIKYIMDEGTNLLNLILILILNEAVNRKLQEALHLILENNLDPISALSSLLDCKDKPLEKLKHQSTQKKIFCQTLWLVVIVSIMITIFWWLLTEPHFILIGMIEAERITLPV